METQDSNIIYLIIPYYRILENFQIRRERKKFRKIMMRKVKSLGKIGREKSRVQEQLEGKRIEFKNNRKGKG